MFFFICIAFHLQQQQVFWNPLHRLQEQRVQRGFGLVAHDVTLRDNEATNHGKSGAWSKLDNQIERDGGDSWRGGRGRRGGRRGKEGVERREGGRKVGGKEGGRWGGEGIERREGGGGRDIGGKQGGK